MGNAAVGKSCIVDRYINDNFSLNSAATLSAEFFTKVVTVTPAGCPATKVKMQIWDTAGAEQYRSLTKLYYQKAAVVIMVYSMNDFESLDQLSHWAAEVEENAHKNTIKIVVCAKSDNVEDEEIVPKQHGVDYAREINAEFFMTSAKDNRGIDKMFQKAAELCARHMELRNDID